MNANVPPQFGPSIYSVALVFDPGGGYPIAGTGLISNFPVTLPALFQNVMILNTNETGNNPDTNIFLHFSQFTDNLGVGSVASGRLLQLGCMPNVFPLEFGTQSKQFRRYRFACGIPKNCFLSADYQSGQYTRIVAFYNDDLEVEVFPMTP